MNDLSVVIPVFMEDAKTVETLYTTLTAQGAEVIVVDDGNTMPELNITYYTYPAHMGYGYAIKEGVSKATRPIVAIMDGDGQHTTNDVALLYKVYKSVNDCAMVVGSRWNLSEVWYRWFFRKLLNFTASIIANHYLVDLNSGMRVVRKELLTAYEHILCDTFSFTTSLTMSVVTDNYKVVYIPIDVKPRAYGKSKVKLIKDGLVTVYYILWIGLALRTRHIRSILRQLRTNLIG